MDITGTLLKSVLQQPVDDIHHVLVIGIQFTATTQLHELFEVLYIAATGIRRRPGTMDRF